MNNKKNIKSMGISCLLMSIVIVALGGCDKSESPDINLVPESSEYVGLESKHIESGLIKPVAESISLSIESQAESILSSSSASNGEKLLPEHRIIAYYGNPLSKRMGVLGEYDEETMIAKLNKEVSEWNEADPEHPAIPALHLIATVAQGTAGKAGKYRMIMPDDVVNQVYTLAKENHALLFLDFQTGHDDIRNILPRFEWILKNPDVHVGIDPEFNLISSRALPGTKIGTYDAKDINYVSSYMENLIQENHLPPKLLIIHRFTQNGVTNAKKITLRPDVQIVMNMDGWGPPQLKRGTYRNFIIPESVQYTGFKLFYHNDTKAGDQLMSASDVLKLSPQPLYIQYQ